MAHRVKATYLLYTEVFTKKIVRFGLAVNTAGIEALLGPQSRFGYKLLGI